MKKTRNPVEKIQEISLNLVLWLALISDVNKRIRRYNTFFDPGKILIKFEISGLKFKLFKTQSNFGINNAARCLNTFPPSLYMKIVVVSITINTTLSLLFNILNIPKDLKYS